ncbi:hypothetical protein PTI98_002029 [Pleurotus ostreatus]|nr:hypothetical protein CCMSSC00406_0008945 [Pleurotus cornucopiae]KAJ8703405.1 hypothetical protein PTI98_002029 [Pleurotus ostreatus]KDQ30100.1 hypothetical protein PLEOSDRAFT_1101118 [Pleurotus ostreatus PC15]
MSGFGAPGTLDSFSLEWCDDDHIQSFLQAFPRLNALKCSSHLYNVVSHMLQQSPITTLHIDSSLSYDVKWFFHILRAGAATLKNLKLEDVDFRVRLSPRATPNDGKISMLALEELTVVECCNLPFHITTVEMPNLKVLVCQVYDCTDYLHILRTSLMTLVIEPTIEEPLDQNQIIVDNLCILWFPQHEVGNVKATITSVCVPTRLAHLEVFLPSILLAHPFTTSSDDLEAFVLRLHLDGSLGRVTVTVEDPSQPDILDGVFKELNSLGILEIRVGKPPLLHPSALL